MVTTTNITKGNQTSNPILDKNNVETGIWLPEGRRIYVDKDKIKYLDRHSTTGLAYRASQLLLKI